MRCFVACVPIRPARDALTAMVRAMADLDGVRWVPAVNYHLTLKFLGEVPPEVLGDSASRVAALPRAVVTCRVEEVTGFPHPARARAVVARLAPHRQLDHWRAALAGLPGDDSRSFEPHVTLARSRRGVSVPPHPEVRGRTLALLGPALYASVGGPDGVRYRRVRPGPTSASSDTS